MLRSIGHFTVRLANLGRDPPQRPAPPQNDIIPDMNYYMAVASGVGTVAIYNAIDFALLGAMHIPNTIPVQDLVHMDFSNDSSHLACCWTCGITAIWTLRTGECSLFNILNEGAGGGLRVNTCSKPRVRFNNQRGDQMLICYEQCLGSLNSIRTLVWNVVDARQAGEFRCGGNGAYFSPDDAFIVHSQGSAELVVRDAASLEIVRVLPSFAGPKHYLNILGVSPVDYWIACPVPPATLVGKALPSRLVLWNYWAASASTSDATARTETLEDSADITGLSFSQDGSKLAGCSSHKGCLKVWMLSTNELLFSFRSPATVYSVQFHPDNVRLIVNQRVKSYFGCPGTIVCNTDTFLIEACVQPAEGDDDCVVCCSRRGSDQVVLL